MNELFKTCLIVCPLVFLAGFTDSVAGGGGIISIPAYLLAGLPTYLAVGTNKFVMSFGTLFASLNYMKSGKVLYKVALVSAVGSIIGAFFGTNLALLISERVLKIILSAVLPVVAVFLSLNKDFGKEGKAKKEFTPVSFAVHSFLIGLFIGLYDGMIGPGTGTFLILAFSGILGIDLLTASGCAKVSNLASNLTSMLIYVLNGKVIYAVALPAIVFCMAGNGVGARYAIKGGSKNVRKVMFLVLFMLFVKMIAEVI